MNSIARIQTWCGGAALASLPLLYFGGGGGPAALTAVGLVILAAAMLTTPAMRFVKRSPAPPAPRPSLGTRAAS